MVDSISMMQDMKDTLQKFNFKQHSRWRPGACKKNIASVTQVHSGDIELSVTLQPYVWHLYRDEEDVSVKTVMPYVDVTINSVIMKNTAFIEKMTVDDDVVLDAGDRKHPRKSPG